MAKDKPDQPVGKTVSSAHPVHGEGEMKELNPPEPIKDRSGPPITPPEPVREPAKEPDKPGSRSDQALEKASEYKAQQRATWTGVGTEPAEITVKPGETKTIKGQQDQAAQFKQQEDMTAQELRDWLKETGTGQNKLDKVDAFLKENPEGSGEDLYRHMEQVDVAVGTLRKAGKKLHGDGFEPADVNRLAPADALLSARLEAENLKRMLANKEAETSSLKQQLQMAKKRADEATTEYDKAEMGREKQ